MRPFNEDGFWGDKQKKEYVLDRNGDKIYDKNKKQYKCKSVPSTDWNEHTKAEEWREGWAAAVNSFLNQQGFTERVDHRSYERQGIGLIPTIHMGVAAMQMERRSIRTDRGDINRKIIDFNKELRQLRARIKKVDTDIVRLIAEVNVKEYQDTLSQNHPIHARPINLIECLNDMLRPENKSRTNKIHQLQVVASAFAYLQQHNITTLPQLQENVELLENRYREVKTRFDYVDKRLSTLYKHIHHADNQKKYRKIHDEYKQQKPKKQEAYRKKHHEEITLCEAADKYLTAHLNGKAIPPLKAWKTEAGQLAAEKTKLEQNIIKLKNDVRQIEIIKASVVDILKKSTGIKETFKRVQNTER